MSLSNRFASIHDQLKDAQQEHLLEGYDHLDAASREHLLEELESVDWPEVSRLVKSHVIDKPAFALPSEVEPAPWYPKQPGVKYEAKYIQAVKHGEHLIHKGKVAAFTVAGGQGTRLGWKGPKGTFPATAIRKIPLFQCFAEYLIMAQQRWRATIPWYIMTSPLNHRATVEFFKANDYFGLQPDNVMMFPQQMMPAFDMNTGKALLASPDSLALSPNGHGGSLKALYTSGAIADMKKRGIEQISYVQVDNPLVRVVDPLFLGLHDLDGAQMSSKMLPKREPMEKLGNFCLVNGKVTVIEYSDLPEELAHQHTAVGELRFRAGSIAIHAIRVDFVEHLNTQPGGFALPWHRAEKKVGYHDAAAERSVAPVAPNAIKLETFVFDALPMAETSIILETDRVDEFAPIKNADAPGAQDSPATSKQLQTERAARWLDAHDVQVPRNDHGYVDAVIELPQTTAIYPDDLDELELPSSIGPGSKLLIEA